MCQHKKTAKYRVFMLVARVWGQLHPPKKPLDSNTFNKLEEYEAVSTSGSITDLDKAIYILVFFSKRNTLNCTI